MYYNKKGSTLFIFTSHSTVLESETQNNCADGLRLVAAPEQPIWDERWTGQFQNT